MHRFRSLPCGAMLLLAPLLAGAQIAFDDISEQAGISASQSTRGVAWGDMNNDGWPDLWVGNHLGPESPKFYVNNGDGTFTESTDLINYRSDDLHGVTWSDFDNDGDQDLYIAVGANRGAGDGPNQLLVNESGVLTDRAVEFGITDPIGRGRTPLWVDTDLDGDLDLFLSNAKRSDGLASSRVYLQRDNAFVDGESETGPLTTVTNEFVALLPIGDAATGLLLHGNRFPHAMHDPRFSPFVNRVEAAGTFPDDLRQVRDVATGDFNNDLLQDLFLAQSKDVSEAVVTAPDTLQASLFVSNSDPLQGIGFAGPAEIQVKVAPPFYAKPRDIYVGADGNNPGASTFTLSTANPDHIGLPDDPDIQAATGFKAGFNAAENRWEIWFRTSRWASVNIEVTGSGEITDLQTFEFESEQGEMRDTLLTQSESGILARPGVTPLPNLKTTCKEPVAADFDNDMDLDIYLVCASTASNRDNVLYENLGDGTFTAASAIGAGLGSTDGIGHRVAGADFDRDGAVDLLVTNGRFANGWNVGPLQLLRNRGNDNNWLQIDLEGTNANRDGIGTFVYACTDGVWQMRHADGGVHREVQNHARLHFGLGDNQRVDLLRVVWPSGHEQYVDRLKARQVVRLYESPQIDVTGKPTLFDADAGGVFLWRDREDQPWKLRVRGDGDSSAYRVRVLSSAAVSIELQRNLGEADALNAGARHFDLTVAASTLAKGLNFNVADDARTLISVTRDGVANPRDVYIGAAGAHPAPRGWITGAAEIADGNYAGVTEGPVLKARGPLNGGELRFRLRAPDRSWPTELTLLASDDFMSVSTSRFEKKDVLTQLSPSALHITGKAEENSDYLTVALADPAATLLGVSLLREGLFMPEAMGQWLDAAGYPNAYELGGGPAPVQPVGACAAD